MTNYEALPPRIDHVDELLDVADVTPAEADALHAFLVGAAGPARPNELVGEAAAVSAFRAANQVSAAVPGRSWTRRLAAAFTVKAVVLTGMSLGGVAIAATTGVLPTPLPAKAPKAEIVQPAADDRAGNAADQGIRDAAEGPDDSNPARGKKAQPSPSDAAFPGLCGAITRRAEASDARGLAQLVAAAGGRDKVAGFCADLAADAAGAGDKSSGPGRSDDRGSSGQAGKSERSDKADDDRSGKSEQNDRADRFGNDEDDEKSDDRPGKSEANGKSDGESDPSDPSDSDGGGPDGDDESGDDDQATTEDDSDRSSRSDKSGTSDSSPAQDD